MAIVVTYNAAPWIQRCLDSLRTASQPPLVCVIDNASTDTTLSLVRTEFPEVEVCALPTNVGFGRANNLGLRRALEQQAAFVLLINQDAAIAPDAIERLVAAAREQPGFGILSPLHLDYEGQKFDPQFWTSAFSQRPEFTWDLCRQTLKTVYEVDMVPAALWLLRRELVDRIGGFDPIFFLYGEDGEYIRRARTAGFSLGVVPGAVGYHYHTKHVTPQARIRRRCRTAYAKSVILLKHGHGSLARRLVGALRLRVLGLLGVTSWADLVVELRTAALLVGSVPGICRAVRAGQRIAVTADEQHLGNSRSSGPTAR